MNFLYRFGPVMALFTFASSATGVDETPLSERMSVVGVIAESNAAGGDGIAVLKDRRANRTFAVKTGETVPGEPSFEIKSVRRNAVVVSNGSTSLTLTYFDDAALPVAPVTPTNSEAEISARMKDGEASPKAEVDPQSDAVNGRFFWVGGEELNRQKAQERLEAKGIAAGWESAAAGDGGFSLTINNSQESAAELDASDEQGGDAYGDAAVESEWYDSNDTAAEIIERINSMADSEPRFDPVDSIPPPPSYIE